MKTHIITVIACLIAFGASAQDDYIRQVDVNGNVISIVSITDSEGQVSSFLPSDQPTYFELWAKGTAWDDKFYLLDKKLVNYYLPVAGVEVSSRDTYINTRTRSDQRFQLMVEVSGLKLDPGAPESAKQVLFVHEMQQYDPVTYVPIGDPIVYSAMIGNSVDFRGAVQTSLAPNANGDIIGVEKFTVYSLPDDLINDYTILAQDQINIWPIAKATIEGFADLTVFQDSMPPITVTYKDVYPSSVTYLQLYPGLPADGKLGSVVDLSVKVHDSVVPQNDIIEIPNPTTLLKLGALPDGIYTLEVVTETPFSAYGEVVTRLTFELDRILNIRTTAGRAF